MTVRTRLLVLLAAVGLLTAVAVGAVRHAADRGDRRDRTASGPPVTAGQVTLTAAGSTRAPMLVFRNMVWGPHRDELTSVPSADPDGPRTASTVHCLRFYAAVGTGICLQAVHAAVSDTFAAVILDAGLREQRRYFLDGIPTRARVSPSGHLVAWTVFVSGDSYGVGQFSTRTSILDTRTWTLQRTLEDYQVVKDGHAYRNADVNFWGVTFADDDHFYATLATGGSTYLVRGDVAARTLTTVRENVECPSLAPDGTRLAFKKRVPGLPADAPWRLYVLDLSTMGETPLAENRSVDDQAVWLDDETLTYALPGDFGSDMWTVAANGGGNPRRLLTAAMAPSVVNGVDGSSHRN